MATKTDDANGGGYGQGREIAELQARVKDLEGLVKQLASASALECILENGLGEIAAVLAPLTQIAGPPRTNVSAEGAETMRAMRVALARPTFENEVLREPKAYSDYPQTARAAS